MKVVQRLEFKDVFPDEETKPVEEYLKQVSGDTLLQTIGFCSTSPSTNFDNFFSSPPLQRDIYDRVVDYSRRNGISEKPEVISKYASLKLTEQILSNKELAKNKLVSIDQNELNIFKAFLVINGELNNSQRLDNIEGDAFERLVDYTLIFKFPESDLALFDNDSFEFLKLIHCTIYKVEMLFVFLDSKDEFKELKNKLIKSFQVKDEAEFLYQMKYLFGQLLHSKTTLNYKFRLVDNLSVDFLKSMVSEDIKADEDFTHLKNSPIYFLGDNTFSIVNYFFAIDKFFRSAKFKLKEFYLEDKILKKIYGDYFGFYNKHFSENFLMKKILDEIFEKNYYVKKPDTDTELDGEPDYYIRHNNTVYLFENKDVLVAKAIKSSANIEEINTFLKSKFLYDGEKHVGIGQLINGVEEILQKKFRFDDYVNTKNNLEIYPVLIIQDRIFQSPGINYRLNKWYFKSLQDRLGGKFNISRVKGLTVIDIDTLIAWIPYLKAKNQNLKNVITDHLKRMQTIKKINVPNVKEGYDRAHKLLREQTTAISYREVPFTIDPEHFIEKFADVFPETKS